MASQRISTLSAKWFKKRVVFCENALIKPLLHAQDPTCQEHSSVPPLNKIVSQPGQRAHSAFWERGPLMAGESLSKEWICPRESCFQMSGIRHFRILAGPAYNLDAPLLDVLVRRLPLFPKQKA